MNPRWLLRMASLARRPPSRARVYLYCGVIISALLLVAIEHWIGWPSWLTIETDRFRLGRSL